MKNKIVVYGSYGYTGKLIVDVAKQKGLEVILAGRKEEALKQQSSSCGYPYQVVAIEDAGALEKLLQSAFAVIHCGGPFQFTAKAMAEACLKTKTHYTDITGEYQVFELLAGYDQRAKDAGIMIMPGTGFDVVPSDCLAKHLKNRLPSATHLQLAFTMSNGGLSRGTKKSMTTGLGYGGRIRKNGVLTHLEIGEKSMTVDFGSFKTPTLCIPWGDISTAWRSTGIPNIEVYTGATAGMIKNAKRTRYFNWFLRMGWVKKMMLNKIDQQRPGPSQEKIESGRSFLWGKVWDDMGNHAESRIETVSGYKLTALTAVNIVEKIAAQNFRAGYQTPTMAYGADLIMEIESTTKIDV